MRPRFIVGGFDYTRQSEVVVGPKGLTTQRSQATTFRSCQRALRAAERYSTTERPLRDALVLSVYVPC